MIVKKGRLQDHFIFQFALDTLDPRKFPLCLFQCCELLELKELIWLFPIVLCILDLLMQCVFCFFPLNNTHFAEGGKFRLILCGMDDLPNLCLFCHYFSFYIAAVEVIKLVSSLWFASRVLLQTSFMSTMISSATKMRFLVTLTLSLQRVSSRNFWYLFLDLY